MNTFSKLYDTELHNQEIKSNKRTLMGFCWFFLTLLLVWVLTMINFFLISKIFNQSFTGIYGTLTHSSCHYL